MKAAIISLGSVSSKMIAKAMKKYFTQIDEIEIKEIEIVMSGDRYSVMYKGKPLDKYDCIYARGSFKYADLLQSLTVAIGDSAYMPMKARSFTIGHDKLLTQLELQKAKVPMPETYISPTAESARSLLQTVNYPIIMKLPKGTHGKGVMFAESIETAVTMLDALTTLKQPVIIQEYIETGSTDTRAIVVGDKIVACMKRKAEQGEKRANIHAGGSGESCVLDTHTTKIAIEAAKAVGADICAVDLLEGPKGPVVIEVNLSPGLQGITKVTKSDVADKIAKWLASQTKETTDTSKKTGTTKILEELGIEETGNGKENGDSNEIITNLDFRGDRILLPEVVTKISKFNDKEELSVKAEKGKITIQKFDINSGE